MGIRIDQVTHLGATGVVLNGGVLHERMVAHINGLSMHPSAQALNSGPDIQALAAFVVEHKVDFLAAGQVRGKQQVEETRYLLDSIGREETMIVAKIDSPDGLRNLDEIIDCEFTDAVMIARGTLGLDIPPDKVPLAQSLIITKCKVRIWVRSNQGGGLRTRFFFLS